MGVCQSTQNKNEVKMIKAELPSYKIEYEKLQITSLEVINQKINILTNEDYDSNRLKLKENNQEMEYEIRKNILDENQSNQVLYQIAIDLLKLNYEFACEIIKQKFNNYNLRAVIFLITNSYEDILEAIENQFACNTELFSLKKNHCQLYIREQTFMLLLVIFTQSLHFMKISYKKTIDKQENPNMGQAGWFTSEHDPWKQFWNKDETQFIKQISDNIKLILKRSISLNLTLQFIPYIITQAQKKIKN